MYELEQGCTAKCIDGWPIIIIPFHSIPFHSIPFRIAALQHRSIAALQQHCSSERTPMAAAMTLGSDNSAGKGAGIASFAALCGCTLYAVWHRRRYRDSHSRSGNRYGTWQSPVSFDVAVAGKIRIGELRALTLHLPTKTYTEENNNNSSSSSSSNDDANSFRSIQLVFGLQSRPSEKGRTALLQMQMSSKSDGCRCRDVEIGVGKDICSRVHEYGGGAYLVCPSPPSCDSTPTSLTGFDIYFSNRTDQRLYHVHGDVVAVPRHPNSSNGNGSDTRSSGGNAIQYCYTYSAPNASW